MSAAAFDRSSCRSIVQGFTLVEVAVAMLVAFLACSHLCTQLDQRNYAQTQRILEETREALLGFAMANGRLPRRRPPTSTAASARQTAPIRMHRLRALGGAGAAARS